MRGITSWILDADDTLWESAGYFREAEGAFVELMMTLGYPEAHIREEVRRRDIQRLEITGYGPGPYMDTLLTILRDRCEAPTAEIHYAFEAIRSALFNHPVEPYPGVEETLSLLAGLGHRLFLYTMGQSEHQLDKLARSGISGLFEGCVVVPRKTPNTLEELMNRFGIAREKVCVVGNSPRSDISPAIHCGVNAIHVNRPGTWEAELQELPPSMLVATVEHISDIPALLSN